MANSVDPDQTLHSAASDLGLHCLLNSVNAYTVPKVNKVKLTMSETLKKKDTMGCFLNGKMVALHGLLKPLCQTL